MSNNKKALRAMKESKGRFFGLYTTKGEALNVQYVGESPAYVTVYDRNAFTRRKLAKSSVSGVSIQGTVFGKVF